MTLHVRRRARIAALASLALTAALPVAVVRCTPREEGRPAMIAPATSASAPPAQQTSATPPPDAAVAAVAAPEPPPSSATPVAPAFYDPPAPSPYRGAVPATCPALDSAITQTFSERACTNDDDCTVGSRNCSCSQPIAKTAASKLDAFSKAFSAKKCAAKGPPRPCASCPPPLPPKCASGKCS